MLELWITAVVLLFVPYEYVPWALIAVALLGLPGIRARWGGAPYVWTDAKTQATMLRFAAIKPGEIAYDLGCGDGRLVRAAARRGAKATGIEASLLTCALAWAWSLPVRHASIRFGDLWGRGYADADVIFCYMLVKSMDRFEREIWPTLKPGCRVVSNSFRMKGLEPSAAQDGVYLYHKSL